MINTKFSFEKAVEILEGEDNIRILPPSQFDSTEITYSVGLDNFNSLVIPKGLLNIEDFKEVGWTLSVPRKYIIYFSEKDEYPIVNINTGIIIEDIDSTLININVLDFIDKGWVTKKNFDNSMEILKKYNVI